MTYRVFFCAAVFAWGCGAEEGTRGAQTGEACVDSELLAQCPPNTEATLEANASTQCNAAGSIAISNDGLSMESGVSGAVSQVCVGTGECRVVCTLIQPCDHGIMSISAMEGIVCNPPPANPCGNGVCEAGENPTNCEVDCGGSACGNMVCESTEDPMTCPQDCVQTGCGNDACEPGETPETCPQDCETACGNELCEPGEDPETCPQDCRQAGC
ncbi:MAG: hypothetical protein CMH52_13395, partial [Myxococcales bacterium]|nr:hypothetical protein [Myxococcales bacterium]